MTGKHIAVIGGGPAGAATALSLLKNVDSSEFEVAIYHRPATKRWTVGETIPPAANPVLNELGVKHLLDASAHIPCPGSISVWGDDKPTANDFLVDLDGPGYHLDREKFESDLLAAAEQAGARIMPEHTLCKVNPITEGYQLKFRRDALSFRRAAGEKTVSADFVVDATGQPAAFARRLPVARNVIDEVISIYSCMPIPNGVKLPDYTLLEATPGGWWYLSKVPHDRLILSFTTDKDHIAAHGVNSTAGWRRAYAQTQWLSDMLPGELLAPAELFQMPASSAILTVCVGNRWLAAGDAACSYDSITSAGITRSLGQGKLAGEAIAGYFAAGEESLSRYQDRVFEQFNRYVGLRDYLYRREQRFDGEGFWDRRQVVCQS